MPCENRGCRKVLNYYVASESIAFSKKFFRGANSITGGFVYGIVVLIAVYMLLHSQTVKAAA